jgi:hypothetical protein
MTSILGMDRDDHIASNICMDREVYITWGRGMYRGISKGTVTGIGGGVYVVSTKNLDTFTCMYRVIGMDKGIYVASIKPMD